MRVKLWEINTQQNKDGKIYFSETRYDLLKESAGKEPVEGDILKDIRRTFANEKLWFQDEATGLNPLYNILHSYSLIDKELGYA